MLKEERFDWSIQVTYREFLMLETYDRVTEIRPDKSNERTYWVHTTPRVSTGSGPPKIKVWLKLEWETGTKLLADYRGYRVERDGDE